MHSSHVALSFPISGDNSEIKQVISQTLSMLTTVGACLQNVCTDFVELPGTNIFVWKVELDVFAESCDDLDKSTKEIIKSLMKLFRKSRYFRALI